MFNPFAIENSVNNGDKRNVQNQKRVQAEKGQSCVYYVPVNQSITYCPTKVTSYQMCVTPGGTSVPRGTALSCKD